jgi:hypothetical protein
MVKFELRGSAAMPYYFRSELPEIGKDTYVSKTAQVIGDGL